MSSTAAATAAAPTAPAQPQLDAAAVVVELGGQRVLDQVSLSLVQGELGCLLGPSGCGKTTLLRSIAGLQDVHDGHIHLAGREIASRTRSLAPEQRRIGLVFQDVALFPHLDVAGNIGFGLTGLARHERRERIQDLLAKLQLAGLERRYPHELSGGQQQRVAIARALAPQPQLLLLDEPFSSLDAVLRKQLRSELARLLRELGTTALLVTHDQEEAMAFADRVAVMHAGRIEQVDSPWRLYHQPVNRHVAGFVGEGVLAPLQRDDQGWHGPFGRIADPLPHLTGDRAWLLVRPDDVVPDPESPVIGRIEHSEFRGAGEFVTVTLADGLRVHALWPSHVQARIGSEIGLRWQSPHVVAFRGQ